MPGSWMADTSEEEEHPTVPLGINEMTIPRIALVMSVVTLSALLVMTSIIGWSVYTFLNDFEDSLDAGDPAVLQVVTFAVADKLLGEEIGAAIVLADGAILSEAELKAYANQQLAKFKVPRYIRFVDEIPKGATGKLQRIGLAEKLGF